MKPENCARMHGRSVAAFVVFALIFLLAAPFIGMNAPVVGDPGHSGMSSSDAVSTSVSLIRVNPLKTSCKAAEQSGISQGKRSFTHWHPVLLLALITVVVFAVLKSRGVSLHFRQTAIRCNPIAISAGGHAPPFFCA